LPGPILRQLQFYDVFILKVIEKIKITLTRFFSKVSERVRERERERGRGARGRKGWGSDQECFFLRQNNLKNVFREERKNKFSILKVKAMQFSQHSLQALSSDHF
jgi:hypothetical protein